MSLMAHPDHLLRAANRQHVERLQVVVHRRLVRMLRRNRSPVPTAPPTGEVALAA